MYIQAHLAHSIGSRMHSKEGPPPPSSAYTVLIPQNPEFRIQSSALTFYSSHPHPVLLISSQPSVRAHTHNANHLPSLQEKKYPPLTSNFFVLLTDDYLISFFLKNIDFLEKTIWESRLTVSDVCPFGGSFEKRRRGERKNRPLVPVFGMKRLPPKKRRGEGGSWFERLLPSPSVQSLTGKKGGDTKHQQENSL